MPEFTEFEEVQIILLALENPDFFYRITRFMKPEYFEEDVNQYIMTTIYEYYQKFDSVPTRDAIKNIIYGELQTEDELVEPVMEMLDDEIDIRNIPYIKDKIISWAKSKQLALLYDDETIEMARQGDLDTVQQIIDDAASISDVIIKPFKFFSDINELFIENEKEHFTTGFPAVDEKIHDGKGPARKEVYLWVAPTGVGKCHTLESKIIIDKFSVIYDMELEDGTHKKLAGFRKVKTRRGEVMVCDLTEEDDIEELPDINDEGNVYL